MAVGNRHRQAAQLRTIASAGVLRVCIVAVLIVAQCSAQDARDSTDTDSLRSGFSIGSGSLRWRFDVPLARLRTLQVYFHRTAPSIDGVPPLSPAAALELHVGSLARERVRWRDSSVVPLDASSLFVGFHTPSLAFADSALVAVEGWRFGFTLASGHQFRHSSGGVYLLHTGGMTWSYVHSRSSGSSQAVSEVDAFRTSHFGANTGAVIGYSFGDAVSIEASYQRTLLYKNHAFFSWLGSIVLEGLAQATLTSTLRAAEERNPAAVAIATLVLRSALSWGIYELRRTSGQHFPFGGNTPLLWDELRVGTVVFF